MRRALPLLLLIVMVVSSGCDAFDQYTVQNNTDQDLVTWASFYPCSEPSGPPYRAETVVAGTSYTNDFVWGGFSDGPQCVVVATPDRRAVLLQEFRPEATYTVDPPLVPGNVLPANGDLNEAPFTTALMRGRVDALFLTVMLIVLTVMLIAFLLGLLVALFITAKFLFDHYARK